MTDEELKIDVLASRDLVLKFRHDLALLIASYGYAPNFDSPAFWDLAKLHDVESVVGVVGQTRVLMEAATDHVGALIKTLTEPIQTMAPFSCVRCAMEVASLCCWILEPGIDCQERQSRSLALRKKGLVQQRKLIADNPMNRTGFLGGLIP